MKQSIWTFVIALSLGIVNCIKWDAFSTKTAYEWVYDVNKVVSEDALYTFSQYNKTCKAIHVNGIYRHGARNPTSGSIMEINDLHKKLMNYKKAGTFTFLDTWTNPYRLVFEGQLVARGTEELYGLGNWLKSGLKTLLENNKASVRFISSRKSRTGNSGVSFGLGMGLARNITVNDSTTRFYDGCKTYEQQVDGNAKNLIQFTQFNGGAKFMEVSEALKTRLGLNISLTAGKLLYLFIYL